MAEREALHSIEELAQSLYEASDPNGAPWARRGRVVREPWLELARARIARSENRPEPNGKLGPNDKAAS
jgi:hypothetical protein